MATKELSKEEMAREAKRAYMREWNARNKDKVRETQKRYWEKKYKEMQQ